MYTIYNVETNISHQHHRVAMADRLRCLSEQRRNHSSKVRGYGWDTELRGTWPMSRILLYKACFSSVFGDMLCVPNRDVLLYHD